LIRLAWTLPFCNFFRSFGNLVAGILTARLSFAAIADAPLNHDGLPNDSFILTPEAKRLAFV
jgi:hypothetical protein